MIDRHPFLLHNDLAEVPTLREVFAQSCTLAGVADDELEACKLVLTELVNNAIEHGCTRPSDVVVGWYRITDADVEIEVTDPSDDGLTDEAFKSCDPSNFAETGRGAGLFLIVVMTDEISVRPGDPSGTTVRVVKHRARVSRRDDGDGNLVNAS